MKKLLVVLTSALVALAACGGSGSSDSEASTDRVKNAALLPATTFVAGQNMTAPTVVLASTTTLQAPTLSTTPGATITPRPTTTLVAGQNMTAPTVVLASTTTLQAAGVLGTRWQGQTFAANHADTSKFAACTGVTAPALVAATAPAHVQWPSTMAPPVNDSTVDLVLIEASTDNKTWKSAGYNRLKANTAQLTNMQAGQKLFVRAALYRTTATPCITARSAPIVITVR